MRHLSRQDVDGRDKRGHDSGEVVPCLNLSPFAGIACYGDAICGRFTQRYTRDDIEDLYDLMGAARNLQAHYNIAPTDPVEVVRPTAGAAVELVSMRWGLVRGGGKSRLSNCRQASTPERRLSPTSPCFGMRSRVIAASFPQAAITNGSKGRTAGSHISSARRMAACSVLLACGID